MNRSVNQNGTRTLKQQSNTKPDGTRGDDARTASNTPPPPQQQALATSRELELQQQLDYSHEVLRKYKHYVDTKLLEQLKHAQRTVEMLQLDCARYQREKETLMGNVSSKTVELETKRQLDERQLEHHTRELRSLTAAHAEQLAASERRHAAEVAELRAAVDALKIESAQKSSLTSSLAKREEEVKKLRLCLAENASKMNHFQADTGAISDLLSTVRKSSTMTEDFYSSVSAAILQQLHAMTSANDVDFVPLPKLQYFMDHTANGSLSSGAAIGQKLGLSLQGAVAEEKASHEQLVVAQRELVRLLKLLLHAHATAVERFDESVAALEKERLIARTRLEEVEQDHRSERAELLQKIEDAKLKSVLSQSMTRDLGRGQGGDISSILASGSMDMASVLFSSSPQRQKKLRHINAGTQTALDVTVFSMPTASSSTSNSTAAVSTVLYQRALTEVQRLQGENASLRNTVQLLDGQRRRFLGFVNNESISAHVTSTLRGTLSDAVQ